MPAPLWPHLTRFRCICHLHHHLHWPESHHVTLSPTIKVILIKLSEINVGKLANPITSKQGQVHNSTEPLPEVKLGSTGPQLIKSFGHSAQRSPIPYQTLFRSYYEMTLIVVLNGPHSHTSGRWHWRSRGRRKEGKRERLCQKDTWQYMFRLPGYMHCQVEGVGVVIQWTPLGNRPNEAIQGRIKLPYKMAKTESQSTPPSGRPCVSLKGEQASPAPAQTLPIFPTNNVTP